MICAEWWAFEILTLLAGILGVTEQATQVLTFSMCATMFQIPMGIAEASCTIIGNEIGANKVR